MRERVLPGLTSEHRDRDHSPNAIAIPIATAPPKYPQFASTRYRPLQKYRVDHQNGGTQKQPRRGGSRRQNIIFTLRQDCGVLSDPLATFPHRGKAFPLEELS
jgi:hypothetical protein